MPAHAEVPLAAALGEVQTSRFGAFQGLKVRGLGVLGIKGVKGFGV